MNRFSKAYYVARIENACLEYMSWNVSHISEGCVCVYDRGADVNHRDANLRWIALHWAAAVDVEILRLLLDAGSDISAKGRDGATALHNAAIHGKDDCAKLLLERYVFSFSNHGSAGKTPC